MNDSEAFYNHLREEKEALTHKTPEEVKAMLDYLAWCVRTNDFKYDFQRKFVTSQASQGIERLDAECAFESVWRVWVAKGLVDTYQEFIQDPAVCESIIAAISYQNLTGVLMSNALREAALRILNGEKLTVAETSKILDLDKAKLSWYIAVDDTNWSGIKAKLIAENPNYKWPGGTLLSEGSTAWDLTPAPRRQEFVFCKGDDTLWLGDNESYISSLCTKREL